MVPIIKPHSPTYKNLAKNVSKNFWQWKVFILAATKIMSFWWAWKICLLFSEKFWTTLFFDDQMTRKICVQHSILIFSYVPKQYGSSLLTAGHNFRIYFLNDCIMGCSKQTVRESFYPACIKGRSSICQVFFSHLSHHVKMRSFISLLNLWNTMPILALFIGLNWDPNHWKIFVSSKNCKTLYFLRGYISAN